MVLNVREIAMNASAAAAAALASVVVGVDFISGWQFTYKWSLYCISLSVKTWLVLTRGRTDHFAADVNYFQFLIQVCFSSTLPHVWFSLFRCFAFSRNMNIFVQWPWTLSLAMTYKIDRLEKEIPVLGWVTVSRFDFRRRHFISACN